jgi:hypothetical protein
MRFVFRLDDVALPPSTEAAGCTVCAHSQDGLAHAWI